MAYLGGKVEPKVLHRAIVNQFMAAKIKLKNDFKIFNQNFDTPFVT